MNHQRRKFLRAAAAGGALYAFGRTPDTVWAQAAVGRQHLVVTIAGYRIAFQ
jgi:hypothetical protein